jgi:hypothetical protein
MGIKLGNYVFLLLVKSGFVCHASYPKHCQWLTPNSLLHIQDKFWNFTTKLWEENEFEVTAENIDELAENAARDYLWSVDH